jgi:N-acetylglutamate synthase-like GNAT family acetyltransferase
MKAETETQGWTLALRPAHLSDAVDLQRNWFPDQSPEGVQSYLQDCRTQVGRGHRVHLVAEIDGRVVGIGQLTTGRRVGEISSLVVASAHRRRGIGTALLTALIDEAKRRRLDEVEIAADAKTPWIRAWYERQGFVFAETQVLPSSVQLAVLRMKIAPGDTRTNGPR